MSGQIMSFDVSDCFHAYGGHAFGGRGSHGSASASSRPSDNTDRVIHASSVEAGRRIAPENGRTLRLRAQLAHSLFASDCVTLRHGERVPLTDGDSFRRPPGHLADHGWLLKRDRGELRRTQFSARSRIRPASISDRGSARSPGERTIKIEVGGTLGLGARW